MRCIVFAYHEIGYVCLEELICYGAEVPCLFTHKDDPDEKIWFRRPIEIAEKYSIPVYTPKNLREGNWYELIKSLDPDVIFSFYYRLMIPMDIIEIPKIGAFNMHGSLLPKFRGRAPVNWVLVKGEKKTGVTLHYMVEKPDAGDIIGQKEVEIDFEDTGRTLLLKLAVASRELLREMLPLIEGRQFKRIPQTGESSYYGGRKPEDGMINWEEDALTIYNLIRAVTHPYPGAFTYLDGKKLFIWWAKPVEGETNIKPGTVITKNPLVVSTGKNMLRLITVQLEGDKEMDATEFATKYNIENKMLGRN
ncbi:MAG TPA: formyltransferase [Syntrophorhabdaceae bacterium]|nr:formyltransferase [Syntrophorhabdaceae bacterium]HPU29775.1 formyltransferase [Syntrophorhabdaceae bacterium]